MATQLDSTDVSVGDSRCCDLLEVMADSVGEVVSETTLTEVLQTMAELATLVQ